MAIALGGKLMLVMVKQIAKPIASFVKREAKAHPTLGYPLQIMGAFSHRMSINLGRLVTGKSWLSRESVATIAPLSKEHAVEQGAELLGECVIFSVVGGTVAIEMVRQNRVKEAATQKAIENDTRQWEVRLPPHPHPLCTLYWPSARVPQRAHLTHASASAAARRAHAASMISRVLSGIPCRCPRARRAPKRCRGT
jgi:hypothetical protein